MSSPAQVERAYLEITLAGDWDTFRPSVWSGETPPPPPLPPPPTAPPMVVHHPLHHHQEPVSGNRRPRSCCRGAGHATCGTSPPPPPPPTPSSWRVGVGVVGFEWVVVHCAGEEQGSQGGLARFDAQVVAMEAVGGNRVTPIEMVDNLNGGLVLFSS